MQVDYLHNHDKSLFLLNCQLNDKEVKAKIFYCREFITEKIQILFNEDMKINVSLPKELLSRKVAYNGVMINPLIVIK